MDKKTRLTVIFGSTSDEPKVMPDVHRAVEELPIEVRVHFASADNTPKKVKTILSEIKKRKEPHEAYIFGAGMSAILGAPVKSASGINDIVIGIPIDGDKTEGLSSMLSISEKPPLNPVLTVGMNNSYAALNIGYRFKKQKFGKIVLLDRLTDDRNIYNNFMNAFSALGIIPLSCPINSLGTDNVVVNDGYDHDAILKIDEKLSKGTGIQIVMPQFAPYDVYRELLDNTEVTGMVNIGSYGNAAQIVQSKKALRRIIIKKTEKWKSLEDNKGYLLSKKEVSK